MMRIPPSASRVRPTILVEHNDYISFRIIYPTPRDEDRQVNIFINGTPYPYFDFDWDFDRSQKGLGVLEMIRRSNIVHPQERGEAEYGVAVDFGREENMTGVSVIGNRHVSGGTVFPSVKHITERINKAVSDTIIVDDVLKIKKQSTPEQIEKFRTMWKEMMIGVRNNPVIEWGHRVGVNELSFKMQPMPPLPPPMHIMDHNSFIYDPARHLNRDIQELQRAMQAGAVMGRNAAISEMILPIRITSIEEDFSQLEFDFTSTKLLTEEGAYNKLPKNIPITGFELSALLDHPIVDEEEKNKFEKNYREELYNSYFTKTLNDLKTDDFKLKFMIGEDQKAFEFTHPPVKRRIELKKLYENFERLIKNHNVVTHREDTDGGGFHIHLDLPNIRYHEMKNFIIKVFDDFYQRPYLNWVFNNPNDNLNANNWFANNFCCKRTIESMCHKQNRHDKFVNKEWGSGDSKAQGVVYNQDYGTLEFRFFDMPYNKKEFYLIMDFVYSYYLWMQHNRTLSFNDSEHPMHINSFLKRFDRLRSSFVEARDSFYDFLRTLNLNPIDYKVFVERNMEQRFLLQKQYFDKDKKFDDDYDYLM